MPNLRLNLAGQKFGRLTAIRIAGSKNRAVVWLCMCDCGNLREVEGRVLRNGRMHSCGCFIREHARNIGKENAERLTIHGQCRLKTPEYRAYLNARRRCLTKSNPAWPNYGGRGIEFRFASFNEFFDALGPKPNPSYSVDRINNDGHYEAGNVRWATRTEQNSNQRKKRPRNHAATGAHRLLGNA